MSMIVLERILNGIDFICVWAGKLAAYLVLLLIAAVVYEVISRYAFNEPTMWSFEIQRMLGGSLFILVFAWVLVQKGHIRVDLLYQRLSPRGKAILDVVLTLIVVFPLWILVLPNLVEWTQNSWAIHERSSDSAWRNIIYPFKTVAPIAFSLLALALVTTFIRDVRTIFKGK